jgi:hypothetical protein
MKELDSDSIHAMPFRRASESPRVRKEETQREQWRSMWLSPYILGVLLSVEVATAVAIAVLLRLSKIRRGFVVVADGSTPLSIGSLQTPLSQGLLWTTLPTLLVTLYKLFWDSAVTSFAAEVPFIELSKPTGCIAGHSVLLDYRTYPAYKSWLIALKNGHVILGLCLLQSLVVTIVLMPFSAYLFVAQDTRLTKAAAMNVTTTYDAARLAGDIDFRGVFEIFSASVFHGASLPPWTDGKFAFPAFITAEPILKTSNMSLSVDAYSAYLNCQSIPDYTMQVSSKNPGDDATTIFMANDRDCTIRIQIDVFPEYAETYLKTSYITKCEETAGFSRLIIAIGQFFKESSTLLRNISLVSCIPSYKTTRGVVSFVAGLDASTVRALPSFTFEDSSAVDSRPDPWSLFEQRIHQISSFNPLADANSNELGHLILKYAEAYNSSAALDPGTLMLSASNIFTYIYAILSATNLFQPSAPPEIRHGTLLISENRLHVVPWVAYMSIAILCMLVVETVVLLIHLHNNPSILAEEPVGLLGSANLLWHSNISDPVDKARLDIKYAGQVLKFLKSRCSREKAWYHHIPF